MFIDQPMKKSVNRSSSFAWKRQRPSGCGVSATQLILSTRLTFLVSFPCVENGQELKPPRSSLWWSAMPSYAPDVVSYSKVIGWSNPQVLPSQLTNIATILQTVTNISAWRWRDIVWKWDVFDNERPLYNLGHKLQDLSRKIQPSPPSPTINVAIDVYFHV